LTGAFSWNKSDDSVPIIPVVHGTDGKVGRQICSAGFAALSSLDAGYYGKGIYFTSSCLYATPYFATKPEPAILVCFCIPGNVRPIVENREEKICFLGVPIDSGYQSHYVLTYRDGSPITKMKEKSYNEVVLASDPQVVPVFLMIVKKDILMGLIKEFTRDIPGNERNMKESRKVKGSRKPVAETAAVDQPEDNSSNTIPDHVSVNQPEDSSSSMTSDHDDANTNLLPDEQVVVDE